MLRREKKSKLKWSMIRMLVVCWLLPLTIFAVIMLLFITYRLNTQIEHSVTSSMDKAVAICQMHIEDIKLSSRNTSYLPVVRDSYNQWKKDHDRQRFYDKVTAFLAQQYRYNESFLSTMLILLEDKETIYYTHSNMQEATYSSIVDFRKVGLKRVLEESKTLDTDIIFLNLEGHVYMVRNLVEPNFRPYAVLVMELNLNSIFASLKSIWGYEDAKIFINGQTMLNGDINLVLTQKQLMKETSKSRYFKTEDEYYSYQVTKDGKKRIAYLVRLNSQAMIEELDIVEYIFYLLLVFMVVMIVLVFYFFHKKITKPIAHLVQAANTITDGNYGFQLEQIGTSQEFEYLGNAFNAMSKELRYQFETIYLEELALRDAKIKALQSQINPHFLNNTLEIINWEARLSNNQRVSQMIEALSTMLNATMNRKKEALIPLEEELSYVEAYLYIIKQRFQDKFEFVKEIDENLLEIEVPRLIIQPIIENAVEHGVTNKSKRQVTLRIYSNEDYLHIEVEDNGSLTEADRSKIKKLLGAEEASKDEKFVNLGIRNVNQRLKIIYDETCGLAIESNERGHTVSQLLIRISGK